MAGFLRGGNFGKPTTTETSTVAPVAKATPFTKKKLGGLKPKTQEVKEEEVVNTEETVNNEEAVISAKPKLGIKKKLGGLKATPALTAKEEADEIAKQEDTIAEATLCGGVLEEEADENIIEEKPAEQTTQAVEEKAEEPKAEEKVEEKVEEKPKKKSRKKTTSAEQANTASISIPVVDESKRVSIEEMDAIMRPIVAPTTASWEQEKKDVIEALDNIRVEQDMSMDQVKRALAELDNLKFELLPKQHDAETMYDGTRQNYETVKALAISKGTATNAEGRKAEGILALQNFVTPSGEVVDLHQYMLLIEERNKFYQKVLDTVNFKKYSLVNYNNALKLESKDL